MLSSVRRIAPMVVGLLGLGIATGGCGGGNQDVDPNASNPCAGLIDYLHSHDSSEPGWQQANERLTNAYENGEC